MTWSAGVFGIDDGGVNLVINLLILFFVVLWLALIFWTYADAQRRITDPMLVWCAAGASCFPFAGTLVYMLVRPPETLEDRRERELEMQAAEARLHAQGILLCPHCDREIERDFLRCPHCMRQLKMPCHNCQRAIEMHWHICPYCEAEITPSQPQTPAGSRRRRRRRSSESEEHAVSETESA